MNTREGEILLKEKYILSDRVRYYVKPAEQLNVIVLDDDNYGGGVASIFTKIFLPQGFPDSVSKDYLAYQVWDTAQAFCSTITGTLATQEVLRGVGVGDNTATPLAATISWVFKDGCGHLGKILFAYSHGSYLDAYSKKWRLYADTLNDAAMCIEITLPLFPNYTTFALCVSTVMKAIVGVAGGATRAAMTQHHALRGNMADVSAKDSAQETAVNLVASIAALLIISVCGNVLVYTGIFTLMLFLHIMFNYFAVRSVCLRTLNEPRFLQVIDAYLKKEVVDNPCEVNRNEPIIFYQLGPNLLDLKICGFRIKLGSSLAQLVKETSKVSHLKKINEIYKERNYILYPNTGKRVMHVFVKDGATVDDMLCAYFHAVLLAIVTCAINEHTLPAISPSSSKPFAQVCRTVQAAELSRVVGSGDGFIYDPSYDLLRYMDNIAALEWRRLAQGLKHTGWDLTKHLLIVDEWRIYGEKKKVEDDITCGDLKQESSTDDENDHNVSKEYISSFAPVKIHDFMLDTTKLSTSINNEIENSSFKIFEDKSYNKNLSSTAPIRELDPRERKSVSKTNIANESTNIQE